MSNELRLLTITFLVTLGWASPALAAPPRVFVKQAAVPVAQMNADQDACRQQVTALLNGPNSPLPSRQTSIPGQAVANAVANAYDMRGPAMAEAAEGRCMAEKGYIALTLTAEEQKARARARGVNGRNQWYDAFVAQDLSLRIETAAN